jgi:RND family efflux transporter MFP subunit
MTDTNKNKNKSNMSWRKSLLISLAILLVGAGIVILIFSTEPSATRGGATKETAMLVDVIEAEEGDFHPTIKAMGTVKASQDIILSPRVSGEIIERSDNFTPGGFVKKGETLLQIDPSDYENALQQRKSELSQALADLNVEMGRQNVAEKDYKLLDESLSAENKELVLRKPQLDAVKSRVEAAKAAVDQAELNLERTAIKAPFDAHILSRSVNIGSQVSPGQNLGHLVGLDTYWVETTVPTSKLRRINIPDNPGEEGAEVKIRNRTAWQEGEFRTGKIYKLVGALEKQTRMARVLVSIKDPLAYRSESSDLPTLMIGSFVETLIKGEKINDVVRLNRDYIRKDNTVWVMKNGKLSIRDVKIVFKDSKYAYIGEGLNDGEKIVQTNLTTVTEGARLRLQGTKQDSLSQQSEDTTQSSGGGA